MSAWDWDYYYYVRRYRHGEWLHVLVGALLVLAAGLSWLYSAQLSALGLALDGSLFVLAFLVHEMAHKFSAIHYGYHAEFRLQTWGAVLTAISVVIPFFKIIAPGATVIYGPDDRYLMGRTAAWGPATNIAMGAVEMALSYAIPSLQYYLSVAAYVNAFIAFFNLIPLGILDGLKVLRWRKSVWGLMFLVSIIMLAASLMAVP